MLVPSAAWGKPYQYQTTKRLLLTVVGIGAASFVLVVIGLIFFGVSFVGGFGSKVATERETAEQQVNLTALRKENRDLKLELNEQIRQTRQRIDDVNRLIGRLSAFTGLPLDASTTPTTVATTDSVGLIQPNGLGRGGPLSRIPGALTGDFVGQGPRSYAHAREILVFELDMINVRLERAVRHFSDQENLLATTPLICPVQGDSSITDRFGERIHPLHKRKDFHGGLDIGAAYGTPIIAPADGVVSYVGYDKAKGRTLTVDHGEGLYPRDGVPSKRKFKTRYFHCSRILTKKGAKVKRGDVIALIGSTGTSTGNHVHYEVQVDGNPVDPEFFILNGR